MKVVELEKIVDKFIQQQELEKGDRTFETYGRKVEVFQEYLEKYHIKSDNCRSVLLNLKIKEILESAKHYIDTYDIKYKSTTDNYLSALSVFFSFLPDAEGITNEYFQDTNKNKELKIEYEKFAQSLGLNLSEKATPLTTEQYKCLINLCNEKIDTPTDSEILNGANNGVYTYYISSLVTKFTLLYGIKNKSLSEISINDYDSNLNKVNIRGYTVHLPDKLAIQMKRYVTIREKVSVANEHNQRLFLDINATSNWDNAKMYFVLKQATGSTKATSVSKFAIVNMLKEGLPINLVMGFTGYSKVVCAHCQEILDEENGIYRHSEKNRILDATLRTVESFDEI